MTCDCLRQRNFCSHFNESLGPNFIYLIMHFTLLSRLSILSLYASQTCDKSNRHKQCLHLVPKVIFCALFQFQTGTLLGLIRMGLFFTRLIPHSSPINILSVGTKSLINKQTNNRPLEDRVSLLSQCLQSVLCVLRCIVRDLVSQLNFTQMLCLSLSVSVCII